MNPLLSTVVRNFSMLVLFIVGGTTVGSQAVEIEVLHQFNLPDGVLPRAGLTLAKDGNFYGTAYTRGGNGYGTVYRITPSGVFSVLVNFNQANGANPYAGLVLGSDRNLYGTTLLGGVNGRGTVFKVTTSGVFTSLASFTPSEGRFPYAELVEAGDGFFYGTTRQGGSHDLGTVFRISASGVLTTIYHFDSSHGSLPFAGLVQAKDGNLYGMANRGGSQGYGTIFKLTTNGLITTLTNFNWVSGLGTGIYPYASLIQASDGNLYGATPFGGNSYNGYGTAFRISINGSFQTLVNFNYYTNGANPYGSLMQGGDGNFYGTTYSAADSANGTVFKMTPGGVLTTLARFTGDNGALVAGGRLLQGNDGALYGTTTYGGAARGGVIYRLNLKLPPPPPTIMASLTNDLFSVILSGVPGATYVIEYTDSLTPVAWRTLKSSVAPLSGVFEVPEDSRVLPMRFYRVYFQSY